MQLEADQRRTVKRILVCTKEIDFACQEFKRFTEVGLVEEADRFLLVMQSYSKELAQKISELSC